MAEHLSSFTFDFVHIDPRRHIGSHSQPTWELTYLIAGNAMRTVAGFSAAASPGEVVLIPPETEHHWLFLASETEAVAVTLCFSSDLLRGIKSLFPEMADIVDGILRRDSAVVYDSSASESIGRFLTQLAELPQAARVPMFLELLSIQALACGKALAGSVARSQTEIKMDKLRILCECNFSRQIRLADAAHELSMNKAALCRLIRHQTGQTFTVYVNSLRLQQAALYLKNSSKQVSEIAYDVGFSSVSYFNRLFLRRFNMSPSEYRRKVVPQP